MARKQRDREKERFWRDVIQRQAVSGLTVRAFCQQEKLTDSKFYTWRRTIRQRDGEVRSPEMRPAPVPAIVTDEARGDSATTIELAGGRRLEFPPSTSAEQLARFVHALEAGPRAGETEG